MIIQQASKKPVALAKIAAQTAPIAKAMGTVADCMMAHTNNRKTAFGLIPATNPRLNSDRLW